MKKIKRTDSEPIEVLKNSSRTLIQPNRRLLF